MEQEVLKQMVSESVKALTSEQVANMTINAPQNNFFMWAFIVFAFLMVLGFIVLIWLFRGPLDNIATALNSLSIIITKSEAEKEGEVDKFALLFSKLDVIQGERQKTDSAIFQAFREHETNNQNRLNDVLNELSRMCVELKNLIENCRSNWERE